MQITLDTNNLSDLDKQVLALITGGAAPQAAPTPKTTSAPKAEATKPETEKEPETADEPTEADVTADPDVNVGATMEDAVALATKLVSNGKAAQVKAALSDCGAKRVSELSEDKVAEFIAALS